jgi:hypothetical protein
MTVDRRAYAVLLLILLAGSLAFALKWVGEVTTYRESLEQRRDMMHEAILHNQIPPGYGSWRELGASGTNIRVATVYLAEGLHRITGLAVTKIYQILDTAGLFFSFLLLFAYLRQTSPPAYAVVGTLYLGAILPLSFLFTYFHPWDRLSLLCWVALLILLRAQRLVAFAALLAVSITVKYDTLPLPGLYFLANVTRENWKSVVLRSALLFAVTFGVWLGLSALLPGGFEDRSMLAQLSNNLRVFREMLVDYPPLLGLTVPVLLAVLGYSQSDRFSRASVVFGFLLFIPLILASNFAEIRAQLPVLVLLLPSALIGLRTLCEVQADGKVIPARGTIPAAVHSQ